MKFVMLVGRWQPVHRGHIALWRASAWDYGLPALIYVRDIPPDSRNPFTTNQTVSMLHCAIADLMEEDPDNATLINNTRVHVGPDIAAVRYGRKVGYLVEEVDLPDDIKHISASAIRDSIKSGSDDWRQHVTKQVAMQLESTAW